MDRIKEEEGVAVSFLSAIRSPRLEDAGLESCDLPSLDFIIDAFSQAIASSKSSVSTSFSGSKENSGSFGTASSQLCSSGLTADLFSNKEILEMYGLKIKEELLL